MSQTPDDVPATWSAAAAAVVGTLTPRSYGRRIQSMTLVGPRGSVFALYRGYVADPSALLLTTSRGERNTYDAGGSPVVIRAGEAATFVWSGGAAAPGGTARATLLSDVEGWG